MTRALLQDLQRWRKLRHPNLCDLNEVGWLGEEDDEMLFFTMPILSGESLSARLSRGFLEPDDCLAIGEQLARGIDAAHNSGMTYCALSPANIILTGEYGVVITDFGLARHVQRAANSSYTPPEVISGQRPGPAADIYAFGKILSEATEPPAAWLKTLRKAMNPVPAQRFLTATELIPGLRGVHWPLTTLSRRLSKPS